MVLAKLPTPVPLVVFESEVVGFGEVPQQTPRAVTAIPPSFVILPPLVAVVGAIADTFVVERVGIEHANVVWVRVNGNEFPQAL